MASESFQKQITLRMTRLYLQDSGLIGLGYISKTYPPSVVYEIDGGDVNAHLGVGVSSVRLRVLVTAVYILSV